MNHAIARAIAAIILAAGPHMVDGHDAECVRCSLRRQVELHRAVRWARYDSGLRWEVER